MSNGCFRRGPLLKRSRGALPAMQGLRGLPRCLVALLGRSEEEELETGAVLIMAEWPLQDRERAIARQSALSLSFVAPASVLPHVHPPPSHLTPHLPLFL